ncbi:phosphoribosylaminoimidazolecarboxamide formyltransferase [Archaeoglobales archaeon]|nr:MAG: phosphoribosylaminoimidazolecarboxamide formyltransferase [Archaeoglobales archaeon]
MKALISVHDKPSVLELAKEIAKRYEIMASDGTAKFLMDNGIKAKSISEIVGIKQTSWIKTLHPKLYEMMFNGEINIVVVDLYPFEEEQSIENIDIGGVTLIRAAAKANCIVVSSKNQYKKVINRLENFDEEFKQKLIVEAFLRVAEYDVAIARWFTGLLFEYRR